MESFFLAETVSNIKTYDEITFLPLASCLFHFHMTLHCLVLCLAYSGVGLSTKTNE